MKDSEQLQEQAAINERRRLEQKKPEDQLKLIGGLFDVSQELVDKMTAEGTWKNEVQIACPNCKAPMHLPQYLVTLKMIPVCDKCCDEKRAGLGEQERAGRETAWKEICPPIFQDTDLESPLFNYAGWARVKLWTYSPAGLVIMGKSGSCKTRSMLELLKREFYAGRTIRLLWPEELRSIARYATGRGTEAQQIRELGSYELLALDDPLLQAGRDERVSAFLKDLVDYRGRHRRPMILTSQVKGSEVVEQLNSGDEATEIERARVAATMRRIREYCEVIHIGGTTPKTKQPKRS